MKRPLAAVLASTAAMAMIAAGMAPATASNDDPYPKSEGWVKVDFKDTLPKGFACNVAVKGHIQGHERFTVNGKVPPKNWKGPKPGDLLKLESPDETATLTNTKNKKKITVKIDGAFYDRVAKNGKDLHSKGEGRNLYFGQGIRGLLWAEGLQEFSVYDFESPKKNTLDIHETYGSTRELCRVLGAKAVAGKNPPPPEDQQSQAQDANGIVATALVAFLSRR